MCRPTQGLATRSPASPAQGGRQTFCTAFAGVAGITSEWWPASVRNGGRHQIGIPAGIKSEYLAGMRRNLHQQDRNYERSYGIWRNLFGGSRRKIAKKIAKNKRCYANTFTTRSRMLLKGDEGGAKFGGGSVTSNSRACLQKVLFADDEA